MNDMLAVMSDTIPVYDQLFRRFLNYVFSCMNCDSELVRFFICFGVQQAWSGLWEGTHDFAQFVLACKRLILDGVKWTEPALLTSLQKHYRFVSHKRIWGLFELRCTNERIIIYVCTSCTTSIIKKLGIERVQACTYITGREFPFPVSLTLWNIIS